MHLQSLTINISTISRIHILYKETFIAIRKTGVKLTYNRIVYVYIRSFPDASNCAGKLTQTNGIINIIIFSINEINSRKCIYYDITSKQQLSTLLEYGKVNMSDVQSLLGNISKMARVVNEYMLNLDRVILDPGCIYISLVDKKVYFMYSL
jgi:hypothetical protein